ncbi:MAG: DotU family type IV/VI secretion system protein [Desulforegulaceae bacterium]|nr:DotU family type IV/VI secretion system protein [Desulforegulaceae bacterium]
METLDLGGKTPRLIDSFTEIITYVSYFLADVDKIQPEFDNIKNDIDKLFLESQKKAKNQNIKNLDWKKGCFPVAAWVDETILCSNWNFRDKWRKNQLQLRYFKTTNAGAIFFEKLESCNSRELREIFIYCLALGFKGKFFSDDDFIELSEVKADNILKYFSKDQDINIPETLFPEAYCSYSGKIKKKQRKISNFFIYSFFIGGPPLAAVFLFYLCSTKLDELLINLKIIW